MPRASVPCRIQVRFRPHRPQRPKPHTRHCAVASRSPPPRPGLNAQRDYGSLEVTTTRSSFSDSPGGRHQAACTLATAFTA
eukprot:4311870-Prymnesium_polylepis.1